MPRVKRGTTHVKKRNKILAKTKGYKWRRKNTIKQAKTAILKAGVNAYHDRKKKKINNRQLWQIKISAFAKSQDLSYSKLIAGLKKNKIELDRKILADLAVNHKELMKQIIAAAKK